eukprot:CAMPEP_0118719524 /NCGR_PEP_ID=MMETSP0800-20121206/29541_1 /TAXON_ID=210618 ORGANISM="Striatella unipunctata, Strain CCMP2910" /NCGR_SAMPLE_ID=MMETSP0800 /ASSEMBLY_ACC=CAM_ASM_000638 /LENGTH=69 /DNA_ID=CAMNT_0006626939 /DNA_START=427 /DNA_END=636 /DNA_ORIENTATION=-
MKVWKEADLFNFQPLPVKGQEPTHPWILYPAHDASMPGSVQPKRFSNSVVEDTQLALQAGTPVVSKKHV